MQHPHCDTTIVKRVYFDALTPPRLPIPKMRKALQYPHVAFLLPKQRPYKIKDSYQNIPKIRKALQTLQQAGGAYCLVATHENHDVRASIRGFQEGDSLRVLRPKDIESALQQQHVAARYPGYALKMTFDVTEGQAMGLLKVNACWHEIVFKNEIGFTESNFLY